MHYLSVQVQPDLLPAFDVVAIDRLRALDAPDGSILGVEVRRGEDKGPYVNITFATPEPAVLWPLVRKELVHLGLQGASIATCTGSRGWDNYLLLHHYSREVPRARFSAP